MLETMKKKKKFLKQALCSYNDFNYLNLIHLSELGFLLGVIYVY